MVIGLLTPAGDVQLSPFSTPRQPLLSLTLIMLSKLTVSYHSPAMTMKLTMGLLEVVIRPAIAATVTTIAASIVSVLNVMSY